MNRKAFTNARAGAKRRKIAFLLTFEEWSACWQQSGRWSQRGRCAGQFQMDRIDNARGYIVDNIQIVPGAKNRNKDAPHGWRPLLSGTAVADIRNNFQKRERGWSYFAVKYAVSIATIKAVRTNRNWKTA